MPKPTISQLLLTLPLLPIAHSSVSCAVSCVFCSKSFLFIFLCHGAVCLFLRYPHYYNFESSSKNIYFARRLVFCSPEHSQFYSWHREVYCVSCDQ